MVRSEQTSEAMTRSGSGAQGVPGALTNQPPEGGKVQPPGAKAQSQAAAQSSSGQRCGSQRGSGQHFEAGHAQFRDRSHGCLYTAARGRLQKLSVAVLIDNLRSTGEDGKVTETPLAEEQLAKITTLVRSTVGFDEGAWRYRVRGEPEFHADGGGAIAEAARPPIWERPMVRDITRLVAGLVVLVLLLLLVLRPLMKNLTAATKVLMAPPQLPAPAGVPAELVAGGGTGRRSSRDRHGL